MTDRTTGRHLRGLRLDPRSVDAAGVAAWSQLADRAAEPNPFYRPEFLLPNVVERDLSVELLVVTDGDRWVACLPVRRMPATRGFPLSNLAALTDEYSFYGMPLIDRDKLEAAADALLALVRTERSAAVLLVGIIEPDGPVGRALSNAAARKRVRFARLAKFERGGWRRSAQPHFPGPGFRSRDQSKLVRRAQLLAEELGGDLAVVDRTHDSEAWGQFLAMENAGWKADLGTALGSTSRDEAFFLRMCAGMSAVGCLELVSLEVAGHSVAMECHLIDGPNLWSFKIAHNPEYGWFSPGTQLKYRVLEGLHASRFAVADSCAVAQNAHANRMWPDRRAMETVLLPTGSWLAHLVGPMLLVRGASRTILGVIARRRRRAEAATA